jgi:sodium-dependent phosphate cotransporter
MDEMRMTDPATQSPQTDQNLPVTQLEPRTIPNWLRGLIAVAALYLFISSVSMIGTGLKSVARDDAGAEFLNGLFAQISDPMTGLFTGLLVTSLVQSSSFTTSMTVGLVAVGDISLTAAVPIIMGANIGTSVTNLLVSMSHVRRRREFRRSLGGAIVHDFFNVLSVMILLPMEYAWGIISKLTVWFSGLIGQSRFFQSDPTKQMGVLKKFFGLPGKEIKALVIDALGFTPTLGGAIVAGLAMVLLFTALWLLVKMLRGLMQDRLSGVFSKTLFRNPPVAFAVGILITAAVQSSSVTTSLVVPLVGAGILKLRQIYPYTLGANLGTTLTAILAALGTGSAAAMACAFGHLLFNLYGTVIFWPLQFIPISLAKGFARLASRRRIIAVAFLLGVFFILPIVAIIISRLLSR